MGGASIPGWPLTLRVLALCRMAASADPVGALTLPALKNSLATSQRSPCRNDTDP